LESGNLSLQSDKEDLYKELIKKAVYENPGNTTLINHLRNLEDNIRSKVMIDWEKEILSKESTV
jgi:argininosuccinate synthase